MVGAWLLCSSKKQAAGEIGAERVRREAGRDGDRASGGPDGPWF